MVRMQILVDPKHKKLAEKLARQTETSSSEIFRRALEAYDPNKEADYLALDTLIKALQEANRRARQALAEAEAEVEKTIEYYKRDKQGDRRRAAG
jgi:Ca2+-binding EF-hand superfamily protein